MEELHSRAWHPSDQCDACVLLRVGIGQVVQQQIQRRREERKGERQKKEERVRGHWKRYEFET